MTPSEGEGLAAGVLEWEAVLRRLRAIEFSQGWQPRNRTVTPSRAERLKAARAELDALDRARDELDRARYAIEAAYDRAGCRLREIQLEPDP